MGNVEGRGQIAHSISTVPADVDGTLVTATDWYVRSQKAPRVDRESSTTQSKPTVVASFEGMLSGVVKIAGVSEDYDKVANCDDRRLVH
jgi:Tfp pilus assembly protein PilV